MVVTRSRLSLRTRVTLWYTAALAVALVVYAGVVYVCLQRVLWAELDDRLHNDIEAAEGLLQPYWTEDGPTLAGNVSPLHHDDYRWLQVWSTDGRLLFQSVVAQTRPIAQLPQPSADAAVSLILDDGEHVRVKDKRGRIAEQPVIVRVATSENRVRSELAEMLLLMLIALPLCATGAAFGGYHLVRHTLSPITRLVTAASTVTAANLSARLPVEIPNDEVGQIAHAFNETLIRLEASFLQMQRFTANASHELRTPLTALQSTGQVALTDATTVDEHREAIGSMLEDARRLSMLMDTLLLLARSDAGQISLALQSINLLEVVRAVATECHVLSEEEDQEIAISGADALVSADPTVLRIALANVLHNAIRYSPVGGKIRLSVAPSTNGAFVEIEDSGPGIPTEHLPLIFERFYRIDAGRSTDTGGVGLGLAMARWAVAAHHGSIEVRNNPGAGSTFIISLPADPQNLNV